MRISAALLTIGMVIFIPLMVVGEDSSLDDLKVTTVTDAWSIAQQYTGLTCMKNRSQTAMSTATSLIQVEEDKTPFLNKQIENRPIWEVKVGEAMQSQEFDSFDEERMKTPPGLIVWIDASTGRFLKAFTKYGKESPDLCPEPPADSATADMRNNEIWLKFPDEVPVVSLMDALYHSPSARPQYAKELIIHFVVELNVHSGESKPVWSVIARGVQGGGPTHGHTIHPCVDNRLRMTIDATTGKVGSIYMGSPMLLLRDRK